MGFHKSFADAAAPEAWVRNAEWLALPTIITSDEQVSGLYAIFPDIPNHVALLARGAYTVDWGDGGTTENVADNVKAEHTYSYDDVDFDGTAVGEVNAVACTFTDTDDRVNVTGHGWEDKTVLEFATVVTTTGVTALKKYYVLNTPIACTFTDTGDVVTAVGHGFIDDERVNLYNILSTTGIDTKITYYVISATSDTFQLSLTSGGAAVAMTTDGSGKFSAADRFQIESTRGAGAVALTTNGSGTVFAPQYRQTVITVTPQVPAAWTVINFNQNHSAQAATNYHGHPWLDITICGAGLTTIAFWGTTSTRPASLLQQCTIIDHALTSMSSMFQNCYSLRSVPLFDTSSVLSMSGMFSSCVALQSVPLFDTGSVSGMSNMFSTCYSLQTVPLFNTSSVTSMGSMFSNCYSLRTVPLFNTSNVVSSMSAMFSGCNSLEDVPLFNTSKVNSMSSMFYNCYSLQSVPLFDTSSVSNMTSMFSACFSLKSVSLFNTSSVTTMTTMFSNCLTLAYVPLFDTSKVTNFSSMFYQCYSLRTLPAFDFSKVTTTSNFVGTATSISRMPIIPPAANFSVTNLNLDAAALDELYTNLPTATATITVTGCPGTTGDDPTIATAKGWTVTD